VLAKYPSLQNSPPQSILFTYIRSKLRGIEPQGIQSLLVTCKLHGINPHTYLVDVLQRISQHPASEAIELTPRLWKEKFADNPLHSALDHHAR